MIAKTEKWLVERLTQGLGKLVRSVASYGGELDDDISYVVRNLPAVWVTYGGSRINGKDSSGRRNQSVNNFVILIATRSVRSEEAARQGGVRQNEIGSYQLIKAVRRLIDRQGLSRGIQFGMQPKAVKTLFNHQMVSRDALSVFAIEYEAVWNDEQPLDDGKFPIETHDASNPDHVFTKYQGKLSDPPADFTTFTGRLFDPTNNAQNPIQLYLRKQP